MTGQPESIRFGDADAYERFMGVWSRLAGRVFLDWLAPAAGLRWLDVGCGTVAFTTLIAERTQPLGIDALDPSAIQLDFARRQPRLQAVRFQQGDAMNLPYQADAFDCAVMPLVLSFVPDPAHGVAEMARVVKPGGVVAAYMWDLTGAGFPYHQARQALFELGYTVPEPPSPAASKPELMQSVWIACGFEAIACQTIAVQRTFQDFEQYWSVLCAGPSVGQSIAAMDDQQRSHLKQLLQAQHLNRAEPITLSARANAIRGTVPGEGHQVVLPSFPGSGSESSPASFPYTISSDPTLQARHCLKPAFSCTARTAG